MVMEKCYGGSPDRQYEKGGRGKLASWLTNNEPHRLMRGSDRTRLCAPARYKRWQTGSGRPMISAPDAFMGPAYDPVYVPYVEGVKPKKVKTAEERRRIPDAYEMIRVDLGTPEERMHATWLATQEDHHHWHKLQAEFNGTLRVMKRIKSANKHEDEELNEEFLENDAADATPNRRLILEAAGSRVHAEHHFHGHGEHHGVQLSPPASAQPASPPSPRPPDDAPPSGPSFFPHPLLLLSTDAQAPEKLSSRSSRRNDDEAASSSESHPGLIYQGATVPQLHPKHRSRSAGIGPRHMGGFGVWLNERIIAPEPWMCRHPNHPFHGLPPPAIEVTTGEAEVTKKAMWFDRAGKRKRQQARTLEEDECVGPVVNPIYSTSTERVTNKKLADWFLRGRQSVSREVSADARPDKLDCGDIVDWTAFKPPEVKEVAAKPPRSPRSPVANPKLLRSYDHFAELEHNRGRFSGRRAADIERLNRHTVVNKIFPELLHVHDSCMESLELFEEVYFSDRTASSIARTRSEPVRSQRADISGCFIDYHSSVLPTKAMKQFLEKQLAHEEPASPAPVAQDVREASPFHKFSEREFIKLQLWTDMKAQEAFEAEGELSPPTECPSPVARGELASPVAGRTLLAANFAEPVEVYPSDGASSAQEESWALPQSPAARTLKSSLDVYPEKLHTRRKRDVDFEIIQARAYLKGDSRASLSLSPPMPFVSPATPTAAYSPTSSLYDTPPKVADGTPRSKSKSKDKDKDSTPALESSNNKAVVASGYGTLYAFDEKGSRINPFSSGAAVTTQTFRSFKDHDGKKGAVVDRAKGKHEPSYDGLHGVGRKGKKP